MGAYWLKSLPDVLRNAGLEVDTYSGWEVRARSTGGYDDVLAVQVHHTASSTSPANDMDYMWNGSPDRPVGAIYLARDGRLTVGAAGATNTSGKGGPRNTSRGTIPLDSANKYVISIEAANNGVGEPWPKAQTDAYVRAVAALNAAYGLQVGDAHGHHEWTSRKVDPAGSSKYASGSNKWDMDAFRGDVWLISVPDPTPTPPPGDDDDMRLWAATGPDGSVWIGNGIQRRGVANEAELEEAIYHSVHNQGPQIFNYCTGHLVQNKQEIWACKFAEWQLPELGALVRDDNIPD